MFVRASKTRVQPDTYKRWQYWFGGLHLPWLCPALYRVAPHSRMTSAISSWTRPRRTPLQAAPRASTFRQRGLASAVQATYRPAQDDFIPFEGLQVPHPVKPILRRPWLEHSSMATIRDFDPRSLMIINDTLISQAPKFRSVNAISGEVAEIVQTMHACIQVGRLERAAKMMRRLNEIYKPDTSELLTAHNDYLRELIHKIVRTKDQQMVKDVQKWFEVDLRGVGVIPDASTYALMIQAALQESDAKKVDRTIRRYISLADEAGVRDEALSILQILCNDQDFGRVTQIAPNSFRRIDDAPVEDFIKSHSTPPAAHPLADTISDLPEVKETSQKGLGLVTLKKALAVFTKTMPMPSVSEDGGTEEEKKRSFALEKQRQLEIDTFESAIHRWRSQSEQLKSLGVNSALNNVSIGASMWNWHERLVPLIKEDIRKANEAEEKIKLGDADKNRCLYGPFLQLLPAETLSAITILTCMSSLSKQRVDERGLPTSKLVLSIGESIQEESLAENIRNGGEHNPWQDIDHSHRLRRLAYLIKRRQSHDSLTRLVGFLDPLKNDVGGFKWTDSIKARLGAVLVSHLIDAAKMDVSCVDPRTGTEHRECQPVFLHSHTHSQGRRLGVIRFNKAMYEKLTKEPVHCALSKHLPMVVQPNPWTGYRQGAFLEHKNTAVRLKDGDAHSRKYAIAASENGAMNQIFSGLDALARTPWRISRGVLEVMLAAWNSGEALGKLAPDNPQVDYPPEPPLLDGVMARRKWLKDMKKIEDYKCGLKSQRCFQNFQLEIARSYLDETLYFPHNVDFRGRAYPMVPFFNHMGADPCRGLLIFDQGKELGEGGLRWLKIHLANLYGFDKASFEERRKFTDDNLPNIVDSAENPLGGGKWWLQAEDPWQCLGACMELNRALKEPDPRRFISHLPTHQDGTCNGLQHYAALGGDVAGAKQVNLEPGDRPSDIYTAVAEMIKAEISVEAAQGNELSGLLNGKLTRKVVKQTVMTNVYGVTFQGAKKQVRTQLDDIFTDFPDTKTINLDMASQVIAKKIFKSLSTMFNGAHNIQSWLGDCASRISHAVTPDQIKLLRDEVNGKAAPSPYNTKTRANRAIKKKEFQVRELFKSPVIWTTPLQMPVVQPYRRSISRTVVTNLQRINLTSPRSSDPVSLRKQLQAFPPNFIHSLDATHMILTALKCNEMGLSFAAVHDSFWTHAGDVDTMNRIIRDAFIRMHSEDIMGRLAAEFSARYKGCFRLATIKKSSAVGRKIVEWRKGTHVRNQGSKKLRELLLEYRRLELLASDKPEERLEGESMVTPGKMIEEVANENDELSEVTDYDVNRIGHVPSRSRTTKLPAKEDLVGECLETTDPAEPLPSAVAFAEPPGEAPEGVSVETSDGALEKSHNDEDPNAKAKKNATAKGKKQPLTIWLWRPLTFPPVPKKGDFDVAKLRNSQYFFS